MSEFQPNPDSQQMSSSNSNENTMCALAHLSGFAGLLIPFGNIIAPLVLWLLKKDSDPRIARNSLEALNFQITITGAMVAAYILTFVLIGLPFLFILPVYAVVLMIMAAVKTNKGIDYKYPLTVRLVK